MGQYYKPTILAENKKTVVAFLYSHNYGNGLKLMEHSYLKNDFVNTVEALLIEKPQRIVWAGDYADECKGLKTNVYNRGKESLKITPTAKSGTKDRYIVNHDTKQFVDKKKVLNQKAWAIHPLPLLTCEGNLQGGGDYFSKHGAEYVGIWARNLISVESKKPKGYTEIIPNFLEE